MRRALASVVVLLALALVSTSAQAQSATSPAVLAPTPYMGWDTYFALPGGFPEATILDEASELKSTGLEAAG